MTTMLEIVRVDVPAFLFFVLFGTVATRLATVFVTDAVAALRVCYSEGVRRRTLADLRTADGGFVIRDEADKKVAEQAIADYEDDDDEEGYCADCPGCAECVDEPVPDDDGLTTTQRAIAANKAAWEGHIPDDNIPDDRAERLAASRNLADAVSAALEDESRKDREARRKFERDAGKYGRVYYLTNLLAEVRVSSKWKVLYDGSTLFPAKFDRNFPSVADWLLNELRMRRPVDFRLVPIDFKTPDDIKAVKTADEYEEERFLNIAAE